MRNSCIHALLFRQLKSVEITVEKCLVGVGLARNLLTQVQWSYKFLYSEQQSRDE